MNTLTILLSTWLGLLGAFFGGEEKMTPEQYIDKYKDIAIREMQISGIPASITLAQGLVESGAGNSYLTVQARNHFGIKCKNNWTGKTISIDDDEKGECFRVYATDEESFLDHTYFLVTNSRYDFLFDLNPTDYGDWADGLKKAGYATNPKYPEMLRDKIKKYNLDQYDKGNRKIGKEDRIANVKQAQTQFASGVRPDGSANKAKTAQDPRLTKPDREIIRYNGILAYVSKPGETPLSISQDNHMMRWEVRKYNDLKKGDAIEPGTVLYLKPKRRKGKQGEHKVEEGETMYYISQLEGIKLKRLYKLNSMDEGQEPAAGETLQLRKKRDSPPKLASSKPGTSRRGIRAAGSATEGGQKTAPATQGKNTTGQSAANPAGKPASKEDNKLAFDSSSSFHTVGTGESIFAIAGKYGISLSDIQTWNSLKDLNVYPGQKLRVKKPEGGVAAPKTAPATEAVKTQPQVREEPKGEPKEVVREEPKPQPKPATEPADKNTNAGTSAPAAGEYVVQPGETLYAISRKTGVSVDAIKELNGLKDNSLSAGQVLRLRGGNQTAPATGNSKPAAEKPKQAASEPAASDSRFHIVQPGETLFAISRLHKVSVDRIRQLNKLDATSTISPGQKLQVKE